jgi:hypothetical protein
MNDAVFMHEIKNSLSNIYSLIELIEDDKNEYLSYMQLIKKSIMQIKSIESDYDTYKRIGQTPVTYSVINLPSMISVLAAEHKTLADRHKIDILFNCSPLRVETDATKLKQVISNLLSNAIKYNVCGGKVLIECKVVNNKKCIIVKDTGIGMTNAELQSIGTMFYRCKKIDTDGTGLGWALIKSIVDLMMWDIKITSCPKSPFEYTTTVTLVL